MLNRRYIRVKVFQALYKYYQSSDRDMVAVEKELMASINKINELYVYMLLFVLELRDCAQKQQNHAKEKKLATEEDLNPNSRFIENRVFKILDENTLFKKMVENRKLSWYLEESMVKKIFNKIKESEVYGKYLYTGNGTFKEDQEILTKIYKKFIWEYELLHHHIEEKSIYWMDDLAIVNVAVLKTISNLKETDQPESDILTDLFKDEKDDRAFLKELLAKTAADDTLYENQIMSAAKNWEVDRIAILDMILMKMALCEMQNFSGIPIKVSLNEYIELSKDYSTPKSKTFINGILDKLAGQLKTSGEIVKTGRGLVE
ncbi:MAG: transcription antitermination factor NusB [Flavobacteriales bacterium]|nr:transcription antitermination factor NusB [Flavobacteriales bacterium]